MERDALQLESYKDLQLKADDYTDKNVIHFPEKCGEGNKMFNAIFLSPPWGGTGYHKLEAYKMENMYPDFDKIIAKCTEYTPNLILFLPRNTCIKDLITRLSRFQNKLVGDVRRSQFEESGDVIN